MDNKIIFEILNNIEKVMIGKRSEVINIMKGLIAGGHIIIEDVPGVGKTTLVKVLSKSLDLNCSRIQFTPDLLPSDITGISIYNQKNMEFEFKKGPIFSNIVLADEINRTSPKTQSALLEVMEEKQVSDGNSTYTLVEPFIVIATQNPIEHEGTFSLPQAELDRFMIKVKLGYPSAEDEVKILSTFKEGNPLEDIKCVATGEDIKNIQEEVRKIYVSEQIKKYIVDITNATRESKMLSLGASVRASLSLMRIAQASAFINDRDFIMPEDIRLNAVSVLSHRVSPSSYARANNLKNEKIIGDIMQSIPVPRIVK